MPSLNEIISNIKVIAQEAKAEQEFSERVKKLEVLQSNLRQLEQELKLPKEKQSKEIFTEFLSPKDRKKYIKEVSISDRELKKFAKQLKERKKEKKLTKTFSVYKTNFYSRVSNFFMEAISFRLEKNYPDGFRRLTSDLAAADINILSKTYVSIALFSALIAFPVGFGILLLILREIVLATMLAVLCVPAVGIFVYQYPSIKKNERRNRIKQELVFAVVHMAAIAGSGAKPVEIFKQLRESRDYEELDTEFKRIDNYMNLFGYSLTNALRAVSSITPSPELEELLSGIISTIETGGDLKQNLEDKAKDSLNSFRLDQKKNLQKIETYSDIYTGLLIAGPLLLIVTLAILERISPTLGGFSIATLAMGGVFILLPVLNAIFMLILETSKTGV